MVARRRRGGRRPGCRTAASAWHQARSHWCPSSIVRPAGGHDDSDNFDPVAALKYRD
jgi:hypothetical protein